MFQIVLLSHHHQVVLNCFDKGLNIIVTVSSTLAGSHAQLLWSPNHISDTALENYLSSINSLLHTQEGLPGGSLQRDNEQALYILTLCNYDVTKALDEFSKAVLTTQG